MPSVCRPAALGHHRATPDALDDALAALTDDDLLSLSELADDATGPTAGVLVTLANAADHELDRRSGIEFERLPIAHAIDPADLDANLVLAAGLADRPGDVPGIRAVIAAVFAEIIEGQRRH